MWIRSQDGTELIKVNGKVGVYQMDATCNGRYRLFNEWRIEVDDIDMAVYSTEEKAMKVLDMIQEQLTSNTIMSFTLAPTVFQMPKDEEVV